MFRSLLEDLIYESPEFWKLFSSSHFWCHYIKTAWFPIPLVWAVPNLGLWPEKLIQHKFTWHGRICCLVHKQCGKTRINWMSLVIKSRWCASESPVCLPKKTYPFLSSWVKRQSYPQYLKFHSTSTHKILKIFFNVWAKFQIPLSAEGCLYY